MNQGLSATGVSVKSSAIPLVSVIVPTWNRASTLERALASIETQSFRDFEILVVDDGSDDGTAELLSHHPAPLRVFSQPNGGVASARNLGLNHAQGEWVAFLDSDDAWYPDKLQKQMRAIRRHQGVALVFSDYEVWDESADEPELLKVRQYLDSDVTFTALTRRNFIGTLTVLVRRDALVAAGAFDDRLKRGSDYDAWLRVARRGPLLRVPGIVARYCRHEQSLTGLDPGRDRNTRDLVLARHRDHWPELHDTETTDPSSTTSLDASFSQGNR